MLKKYGSIYIIICFALLTVAAFAFGTYQSQQAKVNIFAQDGFTLVESEEASLDDVVIPSQVWFGGETGWTSHAGGISFTDAQGNKIDLGEDTFLHYNDGSIGTMTDTSGLDLDAYTSGVIQQFSMVKGQFLEYTGSGFYVGTEEAGGVIANLLLKNSESKYLAASAAMRLQVPNRAAQMLGEGFVELIYPSEDKSIVTLRDSSSEYTFVTKGATLTLENGVVIRLDTGMIMPHSNEEQYASTGTYLTFEDLDLSQITAEAASSSQYSTFRFFVKDGQDGLSGKEGSEGKPGEDGDPGKEGEKGDEGGNGAKGAAGAKGKDGTNNTGLTADGFPGDTVPGVNILSRLPVVRIKEWNLNGAGLYFSLAMDETSLEVVQPQSTLIQLFDLTSGERVQWWDSGQTEIEGSDPAYADGQEIDLADDVDGEKALYTNVLKAGHQYRLSVSVGYDMEYAAGNQEVLTRTFTADDYGIVITQTGVSKTDASFKLEQNNNGGKVGYYLDTVSYSLDGGITYVSAGSNFDNIVVVPPNVKSGMEYNVRFRCDVRENIITEDGAVERSPQPESVYYDFTFTTLKDEPSVGGIKLTAFGSGYFMAEVLGEYSTTKNLYEPVEDSDDAISEILFELSDSADFSNIVATERVSSNFTAFFKISGNTNDPVHTGQTYYVRAEYTLNNGTSVSVLPVLETNYTLGFAQGTRATDSAKLSHITELTMSFVGDSAVWNKVSDKTDSSLAGITFNQISGNVVATLSGSTFVVSKEFPVELQISALPGYYESITYTDIKLDNESGNHVLYTPEDGGTSVKKDLEENVCMRIDLEGLKAETTYMITMYGYEQRGTEDEPQYSRVVLGALSLKTREIPPLEFSIVADGNGTSVGCYPVFGTSNATNYYNAENGNYEEGFRTNTDAVYRGISSIQFELYLLGKDETVADELVGTCEITDMTATADQSTIYNMFYGEAAAETVGKLGFVVGVGEDYTYRFVDKNGPMSTSALLNGDYEIRATVVYDYTYRRYEEAMDSLTNPYDYYTFRNDRSEYINQLNTEMKKTGPINHVAMPYRAPGSDIQYSKDVYIDTEYLTNEEVAEYIFRTDSGFTKFSDLTAEKINADTVVGLKLNSLYYATAGSTTEFTYKGYNKKTFQSLTDADISSYKEQFFCRIKEYEDQNYSSPPEVWIISIPSTVSMQNYFSKMKNDFYTGSNSVADGRNITAYQKIQVGGKNVYVYYIKQTYFDRGLTYYLTYDTKVKGYPSPDSLISFPKGHYDLSKEKYGVSQLLKSEAVPMIKQQPVIYSVLERTDWVVQNTSVDDEDKDLSSGRDIWKVYVQDPDQAIHWKTMLRYTDLYVRGDKNGTVYPEDNNYTLRGQGGLTNLMGQTIAQGYGVDGNMNLEISFSGYKLNAATVYDNTENEDNEDNSLSDFELNKLREMLSKVNGATVTVTELNPDGMDYQVKVDYLLLDDADANQWQNLSVIGHSYIGHHIRENYYNSQSPGDSNIKLVLEKLEGDENIVRVYLQYKDAVSNTDERYLSDAYLNMVRSIAAVEMNAYNNTKKTNNKPTPIYNRDPLTGYLIVGNGNEKVFYLDPSAPVADASGIYNDYRYYVSFRFSEIDSLLGKEGEAELQFDPGDLLTFDFKIHYATGESASLDMDNYTPNNCTIKYVNGMATDPNIYGTSNNPRRPVFVHWEVGQRIPSATASRSLYKVKGKLLQNGTETVPWKQDLTLTSEIFDVKDYENGLKFSEAELSSTSGYAAGSLQVMEVLQTGTTAKFSPTNPDGTKAGITVSSATPTFAKVTVTNGLSSSLIEGTVSNYNLINTPGEPATENNPTSTKEDLAFYYLVYKYELDDKGQMIPDSKKLYGFIKDDDAKTGNVSLRLYLGVNSRYLVEPYYKSESVCEDSKLTFKNMTDATLFDSELGGSGFPVNGEFYLWDSPVKAKVEGAERIIKDGYRRTDGTRGKVFAVVGQTENPTYTSIAVQTNQGIRVGKVSFNLNHANDYTKKDLKITATVSSNIMSDEKASLKLFYFVERCPQNKDRTNPNNWETVIATYNFDTITNGYQDLKWTDNTTPADGSPAYWKYYGDNVRFSDQFVITGDNILTMPFYSGGQIVPGYYYRARVSIAQQASDGSSYYNNVGISEDGTVIEGTYSSEQILWPKVEASDAYAYVSTQVTNRKSNSLKIMAALKDPNATMPIKSFYVRLAKKNKTTNQWELLEDPTTHAAVYREVGLDTEYQIYNSETGISQSYPMEFYGLEPETTYRVQFYAMADPDYDNHINFTEDAAANAKPNILGISGTTGSGEGSSIPDSSILKLPDYYFAATEEQKAEKMNVTALRNSFIYKASGTSVQTSLASQSLGNSKNGSLMIGYSSEITTLPTSASAYAGDVLGNIIANNNNTLTMNFNGAFNAANIAKYELTIIPSPSLNLEVTWNRSDVYKTGTLSLFDATGSPVGTGDGDNGRIYLTLNLIQRGPDEKGNIVDLNKIELSKKGRYQLKLDLYTYEEGDYRLVQSIEGDVYKK